METGQRKSLIGTFIKGLALTAVTGALMAGIYVATSALFTPLIVPLFAATSVMPTILTVGLSTGIFGGIVQTFSAFREKSAMKAAAYSPVSSRDIAITAVSNNLHRPQLQAALNAAQGKGTVTELDSQVENSTRYQDKIAAERGLYSSSLTEKLNRKLSETSHTDRLASERASALSSERVH
jgi:hypothetical protein